MKDILVAVVIVLMIGIGAALIFTGKDAEYGKYLIIAAFSFITGQAVPSVSSRINALIHFKKTP